MLSLHFIHVAKTTIHKVALGVKFKFKLKKGKGMNSYIKEVMTIFTLCVMLYS